MDNFFSKKKQIDIKLLFREFRQNIVKVAADPISYRLLDLQLLWQCNYEIYDKWLDRRMKIYHAKFCHNLVYYRLSPHDVVTWDVDPEISTAYC